MCDEETTETLNAIKTEISTMRIQTVTELGSIKEHLAKLNGFVADNVTRITTTREDVARLEEAKEWQLIMGNREREDRIRAETRIRDRVWSWTKENGIQMGTLGGLIWVIIKLTGNA